MDDMTKEVSVRTNERSEETEIEIEVEVEEEVDTAFVGDVILSALRVGKLIVISVAEVVVGDTGRAVLGGGVSVVVPLVGGRITPSVVVVVVVVVVEGPTVTGGRILVTAGGRIAADEVVCVEELPLPEKVLVVAGGRMVLERSETIGGTMLPMDEGEGGGKGEIKDGGAEDGVDVGGRGMPVAPEMIEGRIPP